MHARNQDTKDRDESPLLTDQLSAGKTHKKTESQLNLLCKASVRSGYSLIFREDEVLLNSLTLLLPCPSSIDKRLLPAAKFPNLPLRTSIAAGPGGQSCLSASL